MTKNTNISLTVEAWAEIVIKEWLNKIKQLGIEGTNNLANSFVHHVITRADGDVSYVEFAFEYYGKMVNWGVGKGVTLEERDMMISSGFTIRKPKPWYDDVFFTQLRVLSHLMAEKYAQRSALIVKTNLEAFNSEAGKIAAKKKSGLGGSRGSIDSATGKRKITYKEFEERRKQNGW